MLDTPLQCRAYLTGLGHEIQDMPKLDFLEELVVQLDDVESSITGMADKITGRRTQSWKDDFQVNVTFCNEYDIILKQIRELYAGLGYTETKEPFGLAFIKGDYRQSLFAITDCDNLIYITEQVRYRPYDGGKLLNN
jgi:hypothetical protein